VKFHITGPSALNTFTAYGDDYVRVKETRLDSSAVVTPEQILPWNVAGFAQLAEKDFELFLGLDLEILLIGTGPKQRFPHPRLTRALTEKRVGVEAMDLQAACRTYNILVAEGRRVGAALLFR
jgi:uncharacterized protein